MKNKLIAFMATVLIPVVLTAIVPACATVSSMLPHVIAAVVDGMGVIDAIAHFVGRYFDRNPNPEAQKTIDAALLKCRKALNAALHVAKGADKIDQARVDAAFEEFKQAYLELIDLVRPYGVSMDSDEKETFSASADGTRLTVPTPESITRRPR